MREPLLTLGFWLLLPIITAAPAFDDSSNRPSESTPEHQPVSIGADATSTGPAACDLQGPANCQAYDGATWARPSGEIGGAAAAIADDFVPLSDTITDVCVWGYYLRSLGNGLYEDCADMFIDDFLVRVFESDENGLPGGIVDSSDATFAKNNLGPRDLCGFPCADLYEFRLTLGTPITGLDDTGGTTYWLSVRNGDFTPQFTDCAWYWSGVDTVANDYSVTLDVFGFGDVLSSRTGDFAFCLNTDLETPPVVERACCQCGECLTITKRACDDIGGSWYVEGDCQSVQCPGVPTNNTCENARLGPPLPVFVDELIFDTTCADTDGPNPTPTELNPDETISNDIWYKVVAPCTCCELVVSTCGTGLADGGGLDPVIAVYHDPQNPTECVCPSEATQPMLLWPDGQAKDENCYGLDVSGGGYVQGTVPHEPKDRCFMVRVGAPAGPFSTGRGEIDVGFYLPTEFIFGAGDDTCHNGNTNLQKPCSMNSHCTAPSVCGLKNRHLTIGSAAFSYSVYVRIVSMPQFPQREGEIWWLGPEQSFPSGSATLRGSALQCTDTPFEQVWTEDYLHIFGAAIIPGAVYEVGFSPDDPCLPHAQIATSKFGDVVAPFGGASQPNFGDVAAIVSRFQNLSTAPPIPRVDLSGLGNPGTPNVPNQVANFADVSVGVDAFRGLPYPFTVPACP